MAVALPSSGIYDYNATGNTTSVTLNASCNLLIVFMSWRFSPTAATATYGGSSLSDFTGGLQNIGGVVYQQGFYLANPPTGANNMVLAQTTSRLSMVAYYGLSGANTSTPFRSQAGANFLRFGANPGTLPSITLTGQTGDLAVDCVSLEAATDTTLTAGGSQTAAFTQLRDTDGSNWLRTGGSSEAGGSSVTMSWTLGASRTVQQLGAMVAAAPAASANSADQTAAIVAAVCL